MVLLERQYQETVLMFGQDYNGPATNFHFLKDEASLKTWSILSSLLTLFGNNFQHLRLWWKRKLQQFYRKCFQSSLMVRHVQTHSTLKYLLHLPTLVSDGFSERFSCLPQGRWNSAWRRRTFSPSKLCTNRIQPIFNLRNSPCSENHPANQSLAEKVGTPLIGCASHRYNFSVREVIYEHFNSVVKQRAIISMLLNIIPAVKLKDKNPLEAKLDNSKKWSSTFWILKRCQILRPFQTNFELDDVRELLPKRSLNKISDTLWEKFT